MARAVLWALGVAGLAALWGGGAAERLAARSGAQPSAVAGSEGRVVTLSADLRGHYTVHPAVDGKRVRMMVDTGASIVALSHEDAQLAGVAVKPHQFTARISTANGIVSAAPIRLAEVRIGEIVVRNVEAVVLPKGALATSLLGMSFLKRIGGFEITGGRLTLRG
ncbi:MAG TPA: TIGR02281 family clan AA aspartic protease [Beijerinckiaceae bacterium]|jgi:aspartyl protease family protein